MSETSSQPEKPESTPVVFSGVQPSGVLTLGTMIGALNNWVYLQDTYACYFCVVDMHAITVRQKPADLRKWTLDCVATFLAAGIDPERSTVFIQSHVPAHAELAWVLSTFTGFGEASRMTQFKDKSQQHEENVNVGLFTYPILMVADILLYQANLVPVGEDQKQHIELTRDVAMRFNQRYGETLVLPLPDIKAEGARVMSLDDPTKKMSKSDPSPNATIALTDSGDTIRKKFKRAVTDSGSEVVASPDKPAVTNLLGIYSLFSGETVSAIEERYAGKGYGAFKGDLGELVATKLAPLQQRLADLEANPDVARDALRDGADRARERASATMEKVRDRMGLGIG